MRKLNERSSTPYGVACECRRGLVRGLGYTEEEFDRPIIAVVNSWNEYNPGHVHLSASPSASNRASAKPGDFPLK